MQPVFFFKIAGIPLFSYTTALVGGVVVALAAAVARQQRTGGEAGRIIRAFAWAVAGALSGGRVLHWVYNLDYFRERPSQLLNIGDGGYSFVGVFAGGLLGLWLWTRRERLRFVEAVDDAALPVAILACAAWLGAFMRGSQYGFTADYGLVLELRDVYGVILVRWATQLIAALWCALIAVVLIIRGWRSRSEKGSLAAFFIVSYSVGLFLLDFTRGDSSVYILGLRLTQWLYVVSVAVVLIGRRWKLALTNPLKINRI